ncbi:choice-of-anchor J domain-containing protein [Myroides odoratus]|uniref:choice-of-anchor J domain-containing protein n=1 Tax=Myroides odoratus TaxID=256 RepID=UPI0039AFFAA8
MWNKKTGLKGVIVGFILIPTLVLSSPELKVWIENMRAHWDDNLTARFESKNKTTGSSNLFFDDPTCEVITTLPFVETFSSDSPTKPCWTVIDNNEDDITWDLTDGSDPYIGDENPVMTTDGLGGENDDWMISPTIQLTGNQRLRYYYKVESDFEPNDFRVMLSTSGTAVASFVHELVPLQAYDNTTYKEEIVYLVDENGVPFTGAVNIAWHVPPDGLDGWRLSIDNVIVEDIPACPLPRNIALSNRTINGVQVDWQQGYQEDKWEVAIQVAGTAAPTSGVEVLVPTYTSNLLNSNTVYDVYVRAKCEGEDGNVNSEWANPIRFRTHMIPANLPFVDGFEGEENFVFVGERENKWHIGTAVNNGGTHAMYISNDDGVSHRYTIDDEDWEPTISHAYKDFAIDADVNELQLSFDWKCMGEGEFWPSDYFRVWLVPVDYSILPNQEIDEDAEGVVQIGEPSYVMNNAFRNEFVFFDGTPYAGENVRLVFEWLNDTRGGTQPPAAIDNIDLRNVLCSRPQNLALGAVNPTGFTVNWTPLADVNTYELLLRTDPLPLATDTDAATHTATGATHTFTGLTTGSFYYVWLRTACDATTKSKWIGPLAVNIPNMTAVQLPYEEDFEGDVYFRTTKSTTNKWVAGNSVSASGTNSLYVTSNNGVSNSYFTEEEAVIHAFKDFVVPAGSQTLDISFVWRAIGDTTLDFETWEEIPGDFMKVWLVPTSFTPTANQPITASADRIEIEPNKAYFENRNFNTQRRLVPSAGLAGQNRRIVFEWIQNDWSGNQPPAAVDNLVIKNYTCADIIDLDVLKVENTNNFEVTWTPGAGQTKWEVFIIENGNPFPIFSDTGIIVEGDPSYIIEDVPEETFFKVFVRPICSENNKGWWTGPKDFSIFHPPGCAGITLEDIELNISEQGEYIICTDEPYTLDLKADFYDIKATTDYVVEPIEYAPPFPFFGGDAVDLTIDDWWSGVIDLGFDFCFYGNSFDKVLINTNGAISFSIEGEVAGGRYEPSSFSTWEFEDEIPIQSVDDDSPYLNAIFGAMQDLDPNASPDDYSVNYQIIGSYPCRALVFNMYHMGLFNQEYDPDDIEGSTQTSQIVLYEGTNIIEVYVKNRPIVAGDNPHNDASGVIGIHNEDGTIAHVPPGRNTGDWVTENEAWRFTPNGASIGSFQWLKNGEFYSNDTDITVTIEESTTFTGQITYEHCNGEEMKIKKSFKFLKEPMILSEPKKLVDCAKKPGATYNYNLEENVPNILKDLVIEDFTLEYYASLADLEAEKDKLDPMHATTTPLTETIFVKVTNKITKCTKTVSFQLGVNPQLGATKVKDIFVCKEINLPALAEGEAYYTQNYGGGTKYEAGSLYTVVGNTTLYVYHEDEKGCYGESSFKIEVLPEVSAPQFDNIVLECEAYELPELPEGTKYYTEANEGGIELKPGYEIIVPMPIYIVARNGNKQVFCYAESSFTVDFKDCPIPKGFSPNGDGINDSFDLSKHGIAKIQIFNREGIEVYSHGLGYKNEFIGKDTAGSKLPAGTYYYVVVSHGKLKTGWVQLNY